jgi:SAM-dependent methyltransferase
MTTYVPREDIEYFLRNGDFSGYQSVPLPHGLEVPGISRQAAADVVFDSDLTGKTVLDVGTYYGFFPAEAIKRGAAAATGVEAKPERYEIANRIAELHGNTYQIVLGNIEELDLTSRFDIVLFLNVLHHLRDPAACIRQLARLTNERLIVEFCLPNDPALLRGVLPWRGRSVVFRKVRARIRSKLLDLVGGNLPLMAVGARPYHRTFYMNPGAFRNMFVVHEGLFSEVEFLPSPTSQFRMFAICRPSSGAPRVS